MGTIDVVIPMGKSSRYNNWELRFALRSLCKHFQHRNVFIVGQRPGWLQNIIHIPAKDGLAKQWNIASKVALACSHSMCSKDVLYMHDDHFFNKDMETVPDYYDGTTEIWAAKHINSVYRQTIRNTTPGLFYDAHTPQMIDRDKFLNMMLQPWGKDHLVKTTYKNTYGANPVYLKECKTMGPDIPDSPFFSTFAHIPKAFMRNIEYLYPERSKYEADDYPKP